jgi:CRISPR-associated protein Csd1
MSWIQKLHETYERCARAPQFASNPPLPISHTTQQAHLEIVIDGHGRFRRASVVPRELCTTIVPCTEESGGRSGKKPVNHPLCDKLQYVAGDFVELGGEVTSGFIKNPHEPHRAYVRDLSAWSKSAHGHGKLAAILTYVEKGRVARDLIDAGILPADTHGRLQKEWEGDKKEAPPIFRIIANPEDSFIRWKVEAPGDLASGTWEDRDLVDSWIAYYGTRQGRRGICMVTGENTSLAEQHPAKLRNAGDKAKLISSNDTSGYTFRGRFLHAAEACGVGFKVTQEAHNALRWLIGRQGYRNGDQVVVAWAVAGKRVPDPFRDSRALFVTADEIGQADAVEAQEAQHADVGDVGQAFARRLNKTIAGFRAKLATDDIVVIGLDSATPGRMAITFYRELTGSEFLDRVVAWHEACAWHQDYGREPTSKKTLRFIGAPSPRDIADAAFGRRLDDKLRKATVERLLPCVIDGRPLPRDLVDSTVRRACNRPGLERWEWEKNLGIACALFKGFFKAREYHMTLETDRTSRDYLYGRLLALAEHIEGRALYVGGESRDTTAAKLMQRFADRPASTWRTIELALVPYKTRLRAKRAGFLHKMEQRLDEVISAFGGDDFLDERKLSGEFLLGYHCERRALKPSEASTPEIGEEIADNDTVQGALS